jgi:hypothetical protein
VPNSVQTNLHRKEWMNMGRTVAEMYMDQGRIEGRLEGKVEGELDRTRTILHRMLRKRFKKVPRRVEARIRRTTDMQALDTWLDNIVDAETLTEVGIPLA